MKPKDLVCSLGVNAFIVGVFPTTSLVIWFAEMSALGSLSMFTMSETESVPPLF